MRFLVLTNPPMLQSYMVTLCRCVVTCSDWQNWAWLRHGSTLQQWVFVHLWRPVWICVCVRDFNISSLCWIIVVQVRLAQLSLRLSVPLGPLWNENPECWVIWPLTCSSDVDTGSLCCLQSFPLGISSWLKHCAGLMESLAFGFIYFKTN